MRKYEKVKFFVIYSIKVLFFNHNYSKNYSKIEVKTLLSCVDSNECRLKITFSLILNYLILIK